MLSGSEAGATAKATASVEVQGSEDTLAAALDHQPRRWTDRLRQWWGQASKAQLIVLAVPVAGFAFVVWVHRYTLEDGFIYYRIADNLSWGDGPVFNAGERVEAGTSPAWVAILALTRALVGSVSGPGVQAAILSTAFATAGLGFGTAASARLARSLQPDGKQAFLFPLAALVVLGSPAMWYFSTSGLETGLCLGWVGLSYWFLARCVAPRSAGSSAEASRADRPRLALVVLGLGWLMRPELIAYSVVFCTVWILASDRGHRWRAVGWMAAAPLAYQVFRMGYFAALVPNTALAKSAARVDWSGGWRYLDDFVSYDRLLIPISVCFVALLLTIWRSRGAGVVRIAAFMAPLIGGLLQMFYVVRSGGDSIHARMLVIPYFAMLLPVAVVAVRRPEGRWRYGELAFGSIAVLIIAAWLTGTAAKWGMFRAEPVYTTFRFGMLSDPVGPDPLEATDFDVTHAGLTYPVYEARNAAANGRSELVDALRADFGGGQPPVITPLPDGTGTFLFTCCIGARSNIAGPSVWVIDGFSLADPIGSRLTFPPDSPFATPQVGTQIPADWVYGRFPIPPTPEAPNAEAARAALSCGQLAALMAAVHEPLTPGRFLDNMWRSVGFTTMEIPMNATEAEAEFCDDAG